MGVKYAEDNSRVKGSFEEKMMFELSFEELSRWQKNILDRLGGMSTWGSWETSDVVGLGWRVSVWEGSHKRRDWEGPVFLLGSVVQDTGW